MSDKKPSGNMLWGGRFTGETTPSPHAPTRPTPYTPANPLSPQAASTP